MKHNGIAIGVQGMLRASLILATVNLDEKNPVDFNFYQFNQPIFGLLFLQEIPVPMIELKRQMENDRCSREIPSYLVVKQQTQYGFENPLCVRQAVPTR